MGGTVEEVRIEALDEHILYAKVRLKNQSGLSEIKARVSDGLSLAMQTNSTIFVEDAILDRLGMDLPDAGRPWEHRFKEMMLRFAGMVPLAPAGQAQPTPRGLQPENLRFEHGLDHWDLKQHVPHLVGETPHMFYESGIDPNGPQGAPSCYLKTTSDDPPQYAMLRQGILADNYRGQRLRLSGDIKAEGVEQQAGLYVRVVDPNRTLTIEDRQEWTVRGTHDWKRGETSIAAPHDAVFVLFGLILFGKGQIWLANVELEVIKEQHHS
jgi:bifunctional nuclease